MGGLAAIAAALIVYYFFLRPGAPVRVGEADVLLRRWGGPALLTLALLAALTGRLVPAAVLVLLAFAVIGYQAGSGAAKGGATGNANAGGAGGPRPRTGGSMGRKEALAVLGLEEGASESDVQEAYRRLIVKVHPDHGGSADLTARLNHARDTLLTNGPGDP